MYPAPVKPSYSNQAEVPRAAGRIHSLVDEETRNMKHKKSDSQRQLEALLLENFSIKVVDPAATEDCSPGPVVIGPNSHHKTRRCTDEKAIPKFYVPPSRLQASLSGSNLIIEEEPADFSLRVRRLGPQATNSNVPDEVAQVLRKGACNIGSKPTAKSQSINARLKGLPESRQNDSHGALPHAGASTVSQSRMSGGHLITPSSMALRRPQVGGRKPQPVSRSNLAKHRMRKRPKILQRPQAKDTNNIYPPSNAYG